MARSSPWWGGTCSPPQPTSGCCTGPLPMMREGDHDADLAQTRGHRDRGRDEGFGRFWYNFIIGDDWTVAAAVAGRARGDLAAAHRGRRRRVVAAAPGCGGRDRGEPSARQAASGP